MAGGSGGKSLEETPTWAVVAICSVLVSISIIIEQSIHLIGKWLKKKHKRTLSEALEKIKSEVMLLGFISLLLTVGQEHISNICISKSVANTWHLCPKSNEDGAKHRRKLLVFENLAEGGFRRVRAGEENNKCATKNQVPFISTAGIHQLHIFIFVLAISHVLCCVLTLALGNAKMRSWEAWEKETSTVEYRFSHDPERFRIARETSFGRRHLSFWTKNPVLIWIICFFMQFVRSVPKVDYLTLRHGFISTHLAPQCHTHFNFQKYINRSLEKDFKVVVGISPPIWFFAMIFIICNTQGSYSYIWLPFIPLSIILLVGTKLQMVITKMAIRIVEKGEVVKGVPLVELSDDLFWFNRPRLMLILINFVLFQNAFQLAFLAWSLMEFGIDSCFHEHIKDVVVRIIMGALIQILCSYVTLPLYALVTQMGSTMKPTIFDEKIATALRNWHHKAKKNIKLNHQSDSTTPFSSCPVTPSSNTLPVYLSSYNKTNVYNIVQNSPSHYRLQQGGDKLLSHQHSIELSFNTEDVQERRTSTESPSPRNSIDVKEISFDRIAGT